MPRVIARRHGQAAVKGPVRGGFGPASPSEVAMRAGRGSQKRGLASDRHTGARAAMPGHLSFGALAVEGAARLGSGRGPRGSARVRHYRSGTCPGGFRNVPSRPPSLRLVMPREHQQALPVAGGRQGVGEAAALARLLQEIVGRFHRSAILVDAGQSAQQERCGKVPPRRARDRTNAASAAPDGFRPRPARGRAGCSPAAQPLCGTC